MKETFSIERCKSIIHEISSDNFDICRGEILDIISLGDQIPIQRNFTSRNTNTDIIIQSTDGEVKLRDFIRSNYNIAPYYHPDGKGFYYRNYMRGNLGGKHIEYPEACTNNFGFRLAIGHETAHAKNHKAQNKNYKLFTHESATHINEKMAWSDGYHIIKNMESTYNIQLLNEFENIESICAYANIHLLSYINSNSADQIKQTLLEPKHFGH